MIPHLTNKGTKPEGNHRACAEPMGTKPRGLIHLVNPPFPVAWKNLRPQHRQRKQAKSQALQASGLSHLGRASVSPSITQELSFNPSLSHTYKHRLTDTMVDMSVGITSHHHIPCPWRAPEAYRDKDGLIKQLRGRVEYIEEKSLLIQDREERKSVSLTLRLDRGTWPPTNV